jgi:hypothetical protein
MQPVGNRNLQHITKEENESIKTRIHEVLYHVSGRAGLNLSARTPGKALAAGGGHRSSGCLLQVAPAALSLGEPDIGTARLILPTC